MKVLIWHDDNGLRVYDATDEARAYQKMFEDMEGQGYWTSVDEPIVEAVPPSPDSKDVRLRRLYQKAKTGDRAAARQLCLTASHEGWEYQRSDIYETE